MRVLVLGYPHTVGGAGPHCWATIRLWRSLGLDVAMLPLCKVSGNQWTERLDGLGVPTLDDITGKSARRGDVVVAFCNPKFFTHADALRRKARLVWVGCMSYVHGCERTYYADHGPVDRVIVNSRFQEATIRPQLEKHYQPEHVVRIPSCFWPDEWRFNPRQRGERFYIGRLSRSAPDKFSSSTWRIYEKIRKAVGKDRVHARVMAWSPDVERKLGPPPDWCDCLPVKAETAEAFLHTLHAMVYRNGGAEENRPRVAFEAMASGVPVVAEDEFGWPEVIRHGETGFLAGSHDAFVEHVAALAKDETLRLRIAQQARDYLPTLIDAPAIGTQWLSLFEGLT